MTDTENDAPFCSKCDASMIRRTDMETAKWFWDCPNECIGTKPRKKPKGKKVTAKPVEETPVLTNAAGVLAQSSSLGPSSYCADGMPLASPEMTALDARLAEVERKIAARRAANAPPVIDVRSDATMPCQPDGDRLYYNTVTDKLMLNTASGQNMEITGHATQTCPGLAQDKAGALRLCGRPTEVLNGVPNKDRLCWVHASPVGSESGTPKTVSWTRWTARVAAILAIMAMFAAVRTFGVPPTVPPVAVMVAVIVVVLVTKKRAP